MKSLIIALLMLIALLIVCTNQKRESNLRPYQPTSEVNLRDTITYGGRYDYDFQKWLDK